MCVMGCLELDTPEHCIVCVKVTALEAQDKVIHYNDLFSDSILKQATITKLFSSLLERREDANSKDVGPSNCSGYPGQCSVPDIVHIV